MWKWLSQLTQVDPAPRRRRTRISALEQLEPRIVLSANVTVVVRGGSLILAGGDPVNDGDHYGADIFVRQNGPGSFRVQNSNGTVNGADGISDFIGVTRDLRFNFGSGDDSLTIEQTTSVNVAGNVTISGGGGLNSVFSEFHNDDIGAPHVSGSLKIGGFLSILSAGGLSISLSNLNVRRDVSFRNLAKGNDVFTDVWVGASEPARRSQIGGNLVIVNRPGLSGYRDQTVLSSLDVKGSVTIHNQATTAFVDIGSSGKKTTIRGSLQIKNGPGVLYQTNLTSVDVNKDVQVANQGSNAVTNIGSIDGKTSIGGSLRIMNRSRKARNTEAPTADTTIQRTSVGRSLDVAATHVGRQNVLLLSSTISGSTHLQTRQGDNSFVLNDAIFKGKFLLQAGGGVDHITVGTTSTLELTAFVYATRMATRTYTVTVSDPITGEIHMETREEQIPYVVTVPIMRSVNVSAAPVKFNGTARLRLGRGNDTLNLGNDSVVVFQKKAVLNGQHGSNTASVGIGKVVGKFKLKHFLDATGFN